MMTDYLQKTRKENGLKAENFVKKFFKAWYSENDEYDLESKRYLIEVKSCKCANSCNKNRKNVQFGRFVIDTDNHIGLFLHSVKKNKIPIYVFVIRIGNQIIWKKVKWEKVKINNLKNSHHIHWAKIFYPQYFEAD